MCTTLHLSALKRSCYLSAQSTSLSMSACIVCLSDSVWTVDETLVSSAYIVHHDSRISGRSLIKITNSTGPSTLPCGTPLVTFDQSEYIPFTDTLCCLPMRKSLIQFRTLFLIPYDSILAISLWCGTESKAFAKSRYTASKGLPVSSAVVYFSRACSKFVAHDLFGTNPCWQDERSFFCSVCSMILSHYDEIHEVCVKLLLLCHFCSWERKKETSLSVIVVDV